MAIAVAGLAECANVREGPRGVTTIAMANSPTTPGLYDVRVGSNGAITPIGTPIPDQQWDDGDPISSKFFQPDESNDDAALRTLQAKYVGRNVFGYGALTMSCAPEWTKFYRPSTPVRVTAILRDRNVLSRSGTGSQLGTDAYGPTVFTFDPIRILFDAPRVKPIGENVEVIGSRGPCPDLLLADFQVPLAFSLRAPPRSVPNKIMGRPVVGMSRDDVIWRFGFPWEIASRKTLLTQSTWRYGVGIGVFSVSFQRDRVSAVKASF